MLHLVFDDHLFKVITLQIDFLENLEHYNTQNSVYQNVDIIIQIVIDLHSFKCFMSVYNI